jgi:exo-beta-1,3-glucanase (GH17 family)
MAFPPGADINAYKQAYQLDESSSSDSDSSSSSSSSSSSASDLARKIALFAKQTKGKNKKIMRFDRDIAQLEAKQRKLMVDFNDLERQLKLLKREREKLIKRIKEDKVDELTKSAYKVGLSLKMTHREAIEPPKKKKRTPIIEEAEESD